MKGKTDYCNKYISTIQHFEDDFNKPTDSLTGSGKSRNYASNYEEYKFNISPQFHLEQIHQSSNRIPCPMREEQVLD